MTGQYHEPAHERARMIEALRERLLSRGLPRFEMSVIVLGAGVVGFITSAALLALGVTSMALRYPVAVLAAYAAFLCILRLWVSRHHVDVDPLIDVPDVSLGGDAAVSPPEFGGGDGGFGGGGAGRSWDGPAPSVEKSADLPSSADAGDGWFDVDLDDAGLLLVPAALALAGLIALGFVIFSAPVLLAEVLLDVALVSGLYKRLGHIEPRYWLTTAVRRTWGPVAAVVIFMLVAGFAMERMVPDAHSIGDALRTLR